MSERIPTVSLGLPVYNGDRYLEHALTRLLEQEYEDFELIICDNASTDSTADICQAFAQRDRRIRYVRNPSNIGLGANHNRTFEMSRGEFFKWVAHDDDFPRTMLKRFVEVLQQAPPTVSLVFSHSEYIDEYGHVDGYDSDGVAKHDPRAHRRLAHYLARVHMYNCPFALIRSDMMRRTRRHGLYPMADHVLFAELAMLGEFIEIPEPLLRIRRHGGRTFTANKSAGALRELFTPGRGHQLSLVSMKGRMQLELVRSAALVPPRIQDKVLCTAVAAVTPQWRSFKVFAGKYKRRLLGQPPWSAPSIPRD